MLTPQFTLPLHHELVVDNFAGDGGASSGIERAIERKDDECKTNRGHAAAAAANSHWSLARRL